LHSSVVQTLPSSVHDVPAVSKQLSAASLHASAHSVPPVHGSPPWLLHDPPLQVSVPLQYRLSVHGAVLFGCPQAPLPLHSSLVQTLPSSVQAVPADTAQLSAPSLQTLLHSGPPVQGSPVPTHVPEPLQVSVAVQNCPSLQDVPLTSLAVQVSPASSHESLQSGPTLCPGHGLPLWVEQVPPLHVSVPLQKRLSLHPVPSPSLAKF